MIVTPQLVKPCITPKTSIVEDEDVSTLSAALTPSFAGSQGSGDTTLTTRFSGDDHNIAVCDVSTGPLGMSINSDGDDYVKVSNGNSFGSGMVSFSFFTIIFLLLYTFI